MDYHGLVKRLSLPDGCTAPTELSHDDIRAHAINRDHLDDDVHGINSSIDLIRRTRGGRWPTGKVTPEFNYVDLVWHECELVDRGAAFPDPGDQPGRRLGLGLEGCLGGGVAQAGLVLDDALGRYLGEGSGRVMRRMGQAASRSQVLRYRGCSGVEKVILATTTP